MVTIACPWCEAEQPFTLLAVQESEVPFTCSECGTTVLLVDEPAVALDLAA